jgi:crotonobetainyl-CoA:carnitine CoA-transferase CaiB-like acyl-CoA transferase
LTLATDLAVVKKLSSRADIIIASYKPGDAEKLGVSYQQLKLNNHRLIYGQITGYGSEDDRVGYDAVIQAESGFMDLNGEKNGSPTKMPVALIDVLAGHQLKEGLLLALLNREKTGLGDLVEVSLVQTAVASLANQATNWLVGAKLPTRQGSAHPNIAPYGESFVTKDGKRILLAVGSDKQFEELKQILGITPAESLGFLTNHQRVANREKLNHLITDRIAQRESYALMQKLNALKIPAGFIQNMKEVFEMAAAKEILVNSIELTGVKSFIAKGQFSQDLHLSPPPHLGEHTREILSSLQN